MKKSAMFIEKCFDCEGKVKRTFRDETILYGRYNPVEIVLKDAPIYTCEECGMVVTGPDHEDIEVAAINKYNKQRGKL